jgi:hypothetical protein
LLLKNIKIIDGGVAKTSKDVSSDEISVNLIGSLGNLINWYLANAKCETSDTSRNRPLTTGGCLVSSKTNKNNYLQNMLISASDVPQNYYLCQ